MDLVQHNYVTLTTPTLIPPLPKYVLNVFTYKVVLIGKDSFQLRADYWIYFPGVL